MGFYNDMYHLYGSTSVRCLKRWANINIKLASLQNRKIFLLKCRKFQVFPDHISNSLVNVNNLIQHQGGRTGRQINQLNLRLRRKILNLEISITVSDIHKLNKDLDVLLVTVHSLLPRSVTDEFRRRLKISFNRRFHNIKNRNISKFNSLKSKFINQIKIQDRWFRNLTQVTFPGEVKTFLALGPKFSIPPSPRDFRIPHLLADLEYIIDDLNDVQKNCLRSQYTNIITNFLHKNFFSKHYMLNLMNVCRRFLKEHPELIITCSDKGNVTVAMYRDDYLQKSQILLDDVKYYKKLRGDPTCTLQQKSNKLVGQLKRDHFIDDVIAKSLTCYNSLAPRFYCLPKIHKPTLSMRPIVSSLNGPNGHLAHFLTRILTDSYVSDNDFFIKDSFSFSTFINDFQLPPGYILVSFDVVSLFTNLPLELVIASLTKNWNLISQHCTLNLDNMLNILKFIFDSNYLKFNEQFYKQIFGTPMGSCISPILVNFVLDDLVSDCLSKVPFNVPFVKRYVDDLILGLPQDRISEVLEIFNSYDTNLQFTSEVEVDNSIPFLDMRIIRDDNNVLRTKWYRKPISSGRYIHYYSYHPHRMKSNLVLALKNRVFRLSHPIHRYASLCELRDVLLSNGYPVKFLNKIIFSSDQQVLDNNSPARVAVSNSSQVTAHTSITMFRSLPFIDGLTSKLIHLFKEFNIKFANRNVLTISKIFSKLKDPVRVKEMSNVVYRIECVNCNKSYVGQTSRTVSSRMISHKSDCRRNVNASALAEHVIETGHHMNYDDVKVVDTESNYKKRLFLEMIHINNESNGLNKRTDIKNLSHIYSYILKLEKDSSLIIANNSNLAG